MGIFWFHMILKRIQFAGCLTLDSATCPESKGKNLHFASKRCEMWEVLSLF